MSRRTLQPDRLTPLLLSVFIAVVILAAAWVNNRPISGPVGEPFTITIHSVSKGLEMHRIDAGMEHPFRIWRSDEVDQLLEPEMQGRTFHVRAEIHRPSKGAPYYRIIEMTAEDGSFTYTWEDYAASQAGRLPGRMIGLVLILAFFIAVFIWSTDVFSRR